MFFHNNQFSDISRIVDAKTRSVSPENFTGEPGRGGMATEGTGAAAARDLGLGWKVSPSVSISAGETFTLADVSGTGSIRHMWFTTNAKTNRAFILRIYWDGSPVPSVEVPLCDFFASADYQKYAQLTSMPVCVNPKRGFSSWWEMPFRRSFRATLTNIIEEPVTVYYQIDYVLSEIPENAGYFHAQFRRVNPLPYREVYTILDNIKGKGQYVGTYMFWTPNNNGWWGEGEIKFYLDGDCEFPTICGTGTEDYFLGAYDFSVDGKYVEYSTPYSGLSKVLHGDGEKAANTRFSMYRWHIPDPIYFDGDIRVTMQALGWREGKRYLPLKDDISSVAYFYLDRISDSFPALPSREFLEIV